MQLPSQAEMTERLGVWAERYRVPGVSMAWMRGDEVVSAAVGVLNVGTGVEATTDSLFQIGSITKIYTTTLIMQLVDEGRIDLDAPAVTYLPDELRFSTPEITSAVTVRHLLTHTSGVDGDYFKGHGRGDDCVAKYVADCPTLPQVFPVGHMWSYCNVGFVVLGRIVEVLRGMTWDEALRQYILDPIGASQTQTQLHEVMRYRAAVGHQIGADLTVSLPSNLLMEPSAGPAGATPFSSAEHLLKFGRLHIDGGVAADGTRVLSEASVRAMQEVEIDLPPQPGEFAAHWGLGWMLFDWGGQRIIGHDGGTIGQTSSLRIWSEEKLAVAVLTNSMGGGLLNSRVMRWMFGLADVELPAKPKPPETPADINLEPYAGKYARLGFDITCELKDGQLYQTFVSTEPLAEPLPPLPCPLWPVSETLFIQQDPYFKTYAPVTFSDFEDGRPRYMFNSRVARRVDG